MISTCSVCSMLTRAVAFRRQLAPTDAVLRTRSNVATLCPCCFDQVTTGFGSGAGWAAVGAEVGTAVGSS